MAEASITFADHEQVRALFGAQDRYLRRVREAIGVDVVVRGDEIRLHGDDEQIRRGMDVLTTLHKIVERTGNLPESEVERVLAVEAGVPLVAERIADPAAGSPASVPSKTPGAAASSGANGGVQGGAGGALGSIEVYEKAKQVRPRTPGQAEYVRTIRENDLVFCLGPAGCGKTYLAVAMAINALRSEQVRKIVLVRPAVEAGERLGFLPGDMLAKVNPYLRPLLDALHDILDYEQVKRYMEHDVVEIVPLAFMRGRTLNDTFIILDEGQNTTVTQMKMFLTRMGEGSKIVVTGDVTQLDLPPNVTSGMVDAVSRLGGIEGVGVVRLSGQDIVRHRLVRDIVEAYDEKTGKDKHRRR